MSNENNLLYDSVFWINIAIITGAIIKYSLKYCLTMCRYKKLRICWGLFESERDSIQDYKTDKLRINDGDEISSLDSNENKPTDNRRIPSMTTIDL